VTGRLTFVEAIREGGGMPTSLSDVLALALAPDGAHLYVSDPGEPLLVVFARDAVSGALTFASELEPDELGELEAMTLSAYGLFLYAGDTSNDAVQVYGRDPVTGALSFLQSLIHGIGAEGIGGPESVALSADGVHLYVGGRQDNAIARFSRDAVTGLLTFVDQVVDGMGGVDGLAGVESLAFSPDGGQLYAASRTDNAVAVFARDTGSGALTFVEAHVDGMGGVAGLDGAQTVAVAPDGSIVLVGSGAFDRSIVLFLRDPVDGSLSFVDTADRALDEAVNRVDALVPSADGAHLYDAHPFANAIGVYQVPSVIFADGFESGDTSRWSASSP